MSVLNYQTNIFDKKIAIHYIDRINKLEASTAPLWGKMNCAQMLSHCSGAFYEGSKKPSLFWRLRIYFFARSVVIGKKPYPRSMKTAGDFIPSSASDFEAEKLRLINGIERVQKLGPDYFLTKKHPIFGKISLQNWDTFFTKHLDHHLRQFGV